MSPYRRNILVGVTVLGAMVVLGWMILKFGDRPARLFATPTMSIQLVTERADFLGDGSSITYHGVSAGRVKSVARTEDGTQVLIDAEIDIKPPLPANVQGLITVASALGGASNISLELTGPKAIGELQPGARITAHYIGLQFLPPEFGDLARELKATAQQFRESNLIEHLDQQVAKAGQVLDSANSFIGDPKLREDVKVTLANLRSASDTINKLGPKLDKLSVDATATLGDMRVTVTKTGTHIDDISKQVNDRMEQLAKTLDHFQSISAKIDDGKGTAGQLVNDPKLYQALVDSTKELNLTVTDLKRLVEQWEQEGVSLKLK